MLTMSSDIHLWNRSMKQNKEQSTTKKKKGNQQEWGRQGKVAVLQVLHLPVFDDVVKMVLCGWCCVDGVV